jgi:H+/Cl- antiporter ClcA
MSVLGEILDGVFSRLRLRSLRVVWHVDFWGLALVIGIASGVAAVLGAPISTTLSVFEMTREWQTGLAVLVMV